MRIVFGLQHLAMAMAAASSLLPFAADAALLDRGGGLLYDDVLNVTWLQDANYAYTSGYDADGQLSWAAAKKWANDLVYHDSVRGVDYSDWRLPTVSPVGVAFNGKFSFDGSTDEAYNITSPNSELSYMYYVNLGLKGYYSPTGAEQTNFGVLGNGTWGTVNVGLVKNMKSGVYWSGTPYAPQPTRAAWMLDTFWGIQNFYNQYDELRAWAVRPGDIASIAAQTVSFSAISTVPEPGGYAMLLAGLGVLGLITRLRPARQFNGADN